MALQLREYIDTNNLSESFQSAYKKNHSTETPLIRVDNDIAMANDSQKIVVLLLMDLSAAFDTVDHDFLLLRLQNRFGMSDAALNWFRSYISDRTQFVRIDGTALAHCKLECYSCTRVSLGTIALLSPLGNIARSHNMNYHLYADDTQLYITFRSSSVEDMGLSKSKIEACVHDIDEWMLHNKLKLNRDETER